MFISPMSLTENIIPEDLKRFKAEHYVFSAKSVKKVSLIFFLTQAAISFFISWAAQKNEVKRFDGHFFKQCLHWSLLFLGCFFSAIILSRFRTFYSNKLNLDNVLSFKFIGWILLDFLIVSHLVTGLFTFFLWQFSFKSLFKILFKNLSASSLELILKTLLGKIEGENTHDIFLALVNLFIGFLFFCFNIIKKTAANYIDDISNDPAGYLFVEMGEINPFYILFKKDKNDNYFKLTSFPCDVSTFISEIFSVNYWKKTYKI